MSKIEIISRKENIIEKVGDILLSSANIANNLVVFPNRRPGYFLSLYLYEKNGKPFESPEIFSIDDFIDKAFELINPSRQIRNADELELLALLYENFSSYCCDITRIKKEDFSLDFFMPWYRKIIGDFEELKINMIKPEDIKDFDFLIKQEDEKQLGKMKGLDGFRNKYARFSQLYEKFYEKCLAENIYTRAMKYNFVANCACDLDISRYEKAVFAGFFALTKSEREIFLRLYSCENVVFIYTASPLLKNKIPFKVDIPSKIENENTAISIKKTGGVHQQVMELRKDIIQDCEVLNAGHESVIVLPDSNMILPVIENVLGEAEKFNISAGYPLKMTPVYSMIQALFDLLSSFKENSGYYQIKKYISFMLHPYIKNLDMAGSSQATRMLLQQLSDKLSKSPLYARLRLDDIEKISGQQVLKEMHIKLIRPFEQIINVGEFATKLADLVDFISEKSTAKRHPYWNYFPSIISEKLKRVSLSKLSNMSFENKSAYFSFMNTYLSGIAHPFKGSPVEGLQCLGFLEARNLKFKNLFIVDVNDKVLPSVKKEDTILPFVIREKLGLPTYKTAYDIYAYYFENMVFSSQRAWLYYIDDKNRQASPILEKLKWELEKKDLKAELESSIMRINFSKSNPEDIEKTPQIKEMLKNMIFSYSSIDLYLNCQLSFYYKYVLKLIKQQDMFAEPGANIIGTIFHELLKDYFSNSKGNGFVAQEKRIYEQKMTEVAFRVIAKYFSSESGLEEHMIKSQILKRAKDFIHFHLENHAKYEVLSCEKEFTGNFKINNILAKATAKIDRIDRRPDGIYLVDYKTSSSDKYSIPSEKFSYEDLNKPISNWGALVGSLQLPFYILIYRQSQSEKNISASIITLGSKEIKESVIFDWSQSRERLEIFNLAIQIAIKDIVTSDYFLAPVDEKPCKGCPYKTICGRQWVRE